MNTRWRSSQAVQRALSAVARPELRKVGQAAVEGENGFVVWAVKTSLLDPTSGPDQKLEVKLDAGGAGNVVSVECDPNDN